MCDRAVFRVAALVLFLLTGGEILACEVLYPNGCESDGVQGSQQTDDCCICCCMHIVIVRPIQLDRQEAPVSVWVAPDTGRPLTQPSHIDHPPKA